MRREPEGARRWQPLRPFLPAVALLLVTFVAVGTAQLAPKPGSRQVAVLFNPLASEASVARAIAGTGARMVRNGAIGSIIVVDLIQEAEPSDLYRAGAWLILDAIAAAGCGLGLSAGSVEA